MLIVCKPPILGFISLYYKKEEKKIYIYGPDAHTYSTVASTYELQTCKMSYILHKSNLRKKVFTPKNCVIFFYTNFAIDQSK